MGGGGVEGYCRLMDERRSDARKKPTAAERYLVNGSFIDPNEHLIAFAED